MSISEASWTGRAFYRRVPGGMPGPVVSALHRGHAASGPDLGQRPEAESKWQVRI